MSVATIAPTIAPTRAPHLMGAADLSAGVAVGTITPSAIAEAYLARIAEFEPYGLRSSGAMLPPLVLKSLTSFT